MQSFAEGDRVQHVRQRTSPKPVTGTVVEARVRWVLNDSPQMIVTVHWDGGDGGRGDYRPTMLVKVS